jgi:hypothetical protein
MYPVCSSRPDLCLIKEKRSTEHSLFLLLLWTRIGLAIIFKYLGEHSRQHVTCHQVRAGATRTLESEGTQGSSDQRRFHFSGRRLATSTPVIFSTSHPCCHHALIHHISAPAISAARISPSLSRVAPSLPSISLPSPLPGCARADRKASRSTRALSPEASASALHPQPSTSIATAICPGDLRPTSLSTAP